MVSDKKHYKITNASQLINSFKFLYLSDGVMEAHVVQQITAPSPWLGQNRLAGSDWLWLSVMVCVSPDEMEICSKLCLKGRCFLSKIVDLKEIVCHKVTFRCVGLRGATENFMMEEKTACFSYTCAFTRSQMSVPPMISPIFHREVSSNPCHPQGSFQNQLHPAKPVSSGGSLDMRCTPWTSNHNHSPAPDLV